MSLVEEELPGVKNVRKDFQLKEDSQLAKQLQDREYEDHFNSNVQLRRTAMEDTKMAKKYQMDELGVFKKQESVRQQQLEAQEQLDFQEAERVARLLEEEEERKRRADEEIALKYHREESDLEERLRKQEEVDMRLARQHFELEQKQKEDERRRRERDNEEAARKFQELEIGTRKGVVTNGTGKTPTPQQSSVMADLPTYDSISFIGSRHQQQEEEDYFEEPIDETARQEEEDARLARELMEKEQELEAKRKAEQERADIEFAQRMMEAEKKGKQRNNGGSNQDFEVAQKMNNNELEILKRQREIERRDKEMAERMNGGNHGNIDDVDVSDWELAKRLQKEELKKARARPPTQRTVSPSSSLTQTTQPPPQQQQQQMTSPTKSAPPQLTSRANTSPQMTGYRPIQDNGINEEEEIPSAKMSVKRQPVKKSSSKKSFFKKK